MEPAGQAPPTRAEVRTWWQDIATGRRTRQEASTWAQNHIGQGTWDEELVLQGLLFLQASTLTPGGDGHPAHSHELDAAFYLSADELGARLSIWETRLRDYDEDPDAWMRGYFRRLISDFAARSGIEAARRFDRKLMTAGHLTGNDLAEALGEAPPTSSAGKDLWTPTFPGTQPVNDRDLPV